VAHTNLEKSTMIRRRTTAILATLATAAALLVASPVATASAEPAGQYVYVCVLTSGNTYTMQSGAKLTTCKGSYLQQYIGGRQVHIWALNGNGKIVKIKPVTTDCVLAIVGSGIGILTAENVLEWVGTATAIASLHTCVA
jgi:hypothetical protein